MIENFKWASKWCSNGFLSDSCYFALNAYSDVFLKSHLGFSNLYIISSLFWPLWKKVANTELPLISRDKKEHEEGKTRWLLWRQAKVSDLSMIDFCLGNSFSFSEFSPSAHHKQLHKVHEWQFWSPKGVVLSVRSLEICVMLCAERVRKLRQWDADVLLWEVLLRAQNPRMNECVCVYDWAKINNLSYSPNCERLSHFLAASPVSLGPARLKEEKKARSLLHEEIFVTSKNCLQTLLMETAKIQAMRVIWRV